MRFFKISHVQIVKFSNIEIAILNYFAHCIVIVLPTIAFRDDCDKFIFTLRYHLEELARVKTIAIAIIRRAITIERGKERLHEQKQNLYKNEAKRFRVTTFEKLTIW